MGGTFELRSEVSGLCFKENILAYGSAGFASVDSAARQLEMSSVGSTGVAKACFTFYLNSFVDPRGLFLRYTRDHTLLQGDSPGGCSSRCHIGGR